MAVRKRGKISRASKSSKSSRSSNVRPKFSKLSKFSKADLKLLKEKEEFDSDRVKMVFFTFLDIIILFSFILSLYYTYLQDYTKTILFMIIGSLLLIFFIIRGAVRKNKK